MFIKYKDLPRYRQGKSKENTDFGAQHMLLFIHSKD